MKIGVDTSDAEKGIKNTKTQAEGLRGSLSKLGSTIGKGLYSGFKLAVKGIAGLTAAAGGAAAALLGLESATEEYRIAQGKLNTAFEAAGYSTDNAKQTYTEFYKILGDTDTATEASQLLAKLALNQEDLSNWTRIAAGVNGTFGDSLPIEGLIESANETAKVGVVTGSLADALNWAGISEDEFNKKLAECSDETERNQLIMDTLSGTYDEASEAFYRNNEALIESRENQAKLQDSMAKLGGVVTQIKNQVLSDFLPSITSSIDTMVTAFETDGVSGMVSAAGDVISSVLVTLAESAPKFIESAVSMVQNLVDGIESNLPQITQAAIETFVAFVSGIMGMLPQLLDMAFQIVYNLATYLVADNNIKNIVDSAIDIFLKLIDTMVEWLPELIPLAFQIVVKLATALVENLPHIAEAALDLGKAVVQGIIDGIAAVWDSLVSWFSGLWDSLFGGKSVDVSVNGGAGGVDGSYAVGLDYVPRNGFIAELHRGEMVLTQREADRYRAGYSSGAFGAVNITVNAAPGQNEEQIANRVMMKIETERQRRAAVFA